MPLTVVRQDLLVSSGPSLGPRTLLRHAPRPIYSYSKGRLADILSICELNLGKVIIVDIGPILCQLSF